MTNSVNHELLIEELKAQRNALADQLAVAGALIVVLRKQLEEKGKDETARTADPPC